MSSYHADALTLQKAACLSLILDRTIAVSKEVRTDVYPVYEEADSDSWMVTEDWNGASGHWIGLLLLAASRSEPSRRNELQRTATRLAMRIARTERTDNVFIGLSAQLAGFGGYDMTGDTRLRLRPSWRLIWGDYYLASTLDALVR